MHEVCQFARSASLLLLLFWCAGVMFSSVIRFQLINGTRQDWGSPIAAISGIFELIYEVETECLYMYVCLFTGKLGSLVVYAHV